MNTLQRIFVACFCGATIGALLAIQFNHYFWWAGILIGGLVGYLSYEFRMVVSAVKNVWNEVCKEYTGGFAWSRRSIRSILAVIKGFTQVVFLTSIVLLAGLSWGCFLIPLILLFPEAFINSDGNHLEGIAYAAGFVSMSFTLMFMLFMTATLFELPEVEFKRAIISLTVRTNAFSVMSRWLPRTITSVVNELPDVLKFFILVAKRTFIIIHSEIRLLCMTDAMLGAITGYFCGNALIGGVVGAIFGVVNYKLVSVRWLKLVRT